MKHAGIVGVLNRDPEMSFEETMVAIRDNLNNLASSDYGADEEDEYDEETAKVKLSEDTEPSWVIGQITKPVQQRMRRLRLEQIKLNELKEPGSEYTVNHICENDKMYVTHQMRELALIPLQTDDDDASPATTTLGECLECLEIVPGISQMLQPTPRSGSSHYRLGSVMPVSNTNISGLEPGTECHTSDFLK